ncbi:MAG: hypothetical protein KAI84_00245 [Gammaproteobacteria bacterium]|nr:hypothetical protein [Gammaproteobacteria bacterium]
MHELIHARIIMERSPHWTQQPTAIFKGYENIVRVANSPSVAPEKELFVID